MLLEIMTLYRSTGERCHIYLNTHLLWRNDVHDFTRSVQKSPVKMFQYEMFRETVLLFYRYSAK